MSDTDIEVLVILTRWMALERSYSTRRTIVSGSPFFSDVSCSGLSTVRDKLVLLNCDFISSPFLEQSIGSGAV